MQIQLRLNDFLFNSGMLGFYRVLEKAEKLSFVSFDNNCMKIDTKALEEFQKDYIQAMLLEYEEDTKWKTAIEKESIIQNINVEEQEAEEKIETEYKMIKKIMESASYKSGYEFIKQIDNYDPYDEIEKIKKEINLNQKKEKLLNIISYLKRHKETYCMKDIIYTKIRLFWENVSFLNKNANKSDITQEYKKYFLEPIQKYLSKDNKSDYTCIECGNPVGKSESFGMAWLKDVGVDGKKKTSMFWNYTEDAILCPVCNLIYSCVPLGFTICENQGIFINQNNHMKQLIKNNNETKLKQLNNMENSEQKMFLQLISEIEHSSEKSIAYYEPSNIQVIKRITKDNNNISYEFNIISKEKLKTYKKLEKEFENLLSKYVNSKNVYMEVLNNFLENKNQYSLLQEIIAEGVEKEKNIYFAQDIVEIQIFSIGGKTVDEQKELSNMKIEMKNAGRWLKQYYFTEEVNSNKLKGYILKLSNSLRVNNPELFIDIVTRMYGSIGQALPAAGAFIKMLTDKDSFRSLGYAYIIGLESYIGENKGGI